MPRLEPLKFHINTGKRYTSAGLSRDCQMMFFYNQQRVSVHEISKKLGQEEKGVTLSTKKIFRYITKPAGAFVSCVTLSGQWVTISTNLNLNLLDIRSNPADTPKSLTCAYGDWEPVGLDSYESSKGLLILVGQRIRRQGAFSGRLLLFQLPSPIKLDSSLPEPHAYLLPDKDFPKNVQIASDGTLVLCYTQLWNKVVLWELPSQSGSGQPCEISTGNHTPVSIVSIFWLASDSNACIKYRKQEYTA